jgi:hypothetical protein
MRQEGGGLIHTKRSTTKNEARYNEWLWANSLTIFAKSIKPV